MRLSDEEFEKIVDEAADDLADQVSMFLDEGEWGDKFSGRCDALGIGIQDYVALRAIADSVIRLRVMKSLISDMDVNIGG
jgi:hypothetical protein